MTSLRDTLASLVALQQIDRQLQRVRRSQAALDNGSGAKEKFTAARDAYEAKNTALHRVSTELKDCELKLASVETKMTTYRNKLYQGTVTNAKELANIEKEIAALGRQRSDLDDKILDLMEQVEQRRGDARAAEAEMSEAECAHQAALARFQSEHEKMCDELSDLTKQRADAVGNVSDAALLKRYDDLRAKAGVGIVQIANHNCGGCNMTLPTAQVKLVRDAEQIQSCENCGRLLAP
ncbi:MAG: zinc ribbon domain-containing protein [Capsulimonadaceae bacterium]